jgi:hypothetical protein
MTTFNKKSSSATRKTSTLTLLATTMMVAGILFTAPSLAMAQQTTTAAPLTPEEQQQQNRLQETIAATTRNLVEGQKQIDGIVFTPRWSNPVWVGPDSLSLLFVYCLPGEFADAGQQILGGSDLEVLESYALAVTNDLMVWFMVVENENENVRLPAVVGAICASDANDVETRVLSPQEQTVINNVIQQFTTIQNTQVTSINQVINIINNVTTNGTGTVTPPPTNNTGGGTPPPTNNTGGGGLPPRPPTGPIFDPILENGTLAPPEDETGTGPGTGPIFDPFPGIFDNATIAPLEDEGGTTQPPGGGGISPPGDEGGGISPPGDEGGTTGGGGIAP